MSSINFKRLSKAFLLEMIRHSNVMDEFVAENMTLPELRAHLDSLTESHGSELEKAKQTVDEMIAQGAVLKTSEADRLNGLVKTICLRFKIKKKM